MTTTRIAGFYLAVFIGWLIAEPLVRGDSPLDRYRRSDSETNVVLMIEAWNSIKAETHSIERGIAGHREAMARRSK